MVKRLTVSLTARELRAEEYRANELDIEIGAAMKSLVAKLDANKGSTSNVSLCFSAATQVDPSHLDDHDLFTDHSIKRNLEIGQKVQIL